MKDKLKWLESRVMTHVKNHSVWMKLNTKPSNYVSLSQIETGFQHALREYETQQEEMSKIKRKNATLIMIKLNKLAHAIDHDIQLSDVIAEYSENSKRKIIIRSRNEKE